MRHKKLTVAIVIKSPQVKSNDRFELLLLTCRDTIGAVTIIPENE
ncbi:MAG TPA: hypothetical protein VIM16_03485 [Mucilaginibacter sp.]|jgi:HipA-like protein